MQDQPVLVAPSFGNIADLLAVSALLLGIVTLLLAIGGVFAFLNVRATARSVAKDEAKFTAEALSESAAVAYLQAEMPALLREYMTLIRNAADDENANSVAEEQENEE